MTSWKETRSGPTRRNSALRTSWRRGSPSRFKTFSVRIRRCTDVLSFLVSSCLVTRCFQRVSVAKIRSAGQWRLELTPLVAGDKAVLGSCLELRPSHTTLLDNVRAPSSEETGVIGGRDGEADAGSAAASSPAL